jgi:hypothetical protein
VAKLQFLGELRWFRMGVSKKWLLLGDFNMILQAADKNNCNLNRRLMGAFRDLIRDLELKELNLRGRKFTWSNDHTQTRIWNSGKPVTLETSGVMKFVK